MEAPSWATSAVLKESSASVPDLAPRVLASGCLLEMAHCAAKLPDRLRRMTISCGDPVGDLDAAAILALLARPDFRWFHPAHGHQAKASFLDGRCHPASNSPVIAVGDYDDVRQAVWHLPEAERAGACIVTHGEFLGPQKLEAMRPKHDAQAGRRRSVFSFLRRVPA